MMRGLTSGSRPLLPLLVNPGLEGAEESPAVEPGLLGLSRIRPRAAGSEGRGLDGAVAEGRRNIVCDPPR